MLDQVITPRAIGLSVINEPTNNRKLVIAREDHCLLTHCPHTFVGADLAFIDLQVDKPRENIQQAFTGERFFPQIGGPIIAAFAWRVARAVAITPIEGKPGRASAFKFGGHKHKVRIDREMHKAPLLEAEECKAWITITGVLMLGVLDVLACHRVLVLP